MKKTKTTLRCDLAIGHIYLIINTVNGKKYVGRSKTVHRRWTQHLLKARRGSSQAIHAAIRLYGEDRFLFESVEEVFGNEGALRAAEIRQILAYKSLAPNGYNLTPGGDGITGEGLRLRSNSPWRENVVKGAQKRAADPLYRERNLQILRERANNPSWRKLNAENNRRLPEDSKWRENHLKGVQARSQNPEWIHNQLEGSRKRQANPAFKVKQAEARRKANEVRSTAAKAKDSLYPPEEAARRARRREQSRIRMARLSGDVL